MHRLPALATLVTIIAGCRSAPQLVPLVPQEPLVIHAGKPVPDLPGEPYFKNVRQLTFGGENAEAYWSGDSKKLIFQSKHGKHKCDQIFTLNLETNEQKLVSTGDGRTTCAYFLQGDKKIVYASTHLADVKCPPPAMMADQRHQRRFLSDYDNG